MNTGRKKSLVNARTFTLTLFFCFAAAAFYYSHTPQLSFGSEIPDKDMHLSAVTDESGAKYSEFPHSKHKQDCSTCHKFPSPNWQRAREDAFPDITEYPRHESCLSCHRRQFFGSPRPAICTICHVNPTPRNTARRPFPNPATRSDFEIGFPHETHIDLVSESQLPAESSRDGKGLFVKASFRRSSEESCAVCHQTYAPQGDSEDEYFTKPPEDLGDRYWLKKGTFKTSPKDHSTCFTCHSTDVGIEPAPSNCAACHKPKPKAPKTDFDPKFIREMKIGDNFVVSTARTRYSSATYRHEWFMHVDLECATCHQANKINTLDYTTEKVPVLSCAPCHITATADDGGILNYEIDTRKSDPAFQCVKCHLAYGSFPVPVSHLKAVEAQAGP